MMKIVHLSVGDPFTAKWVNSQAGRGDEVYLIMLKPPTEAVTGVKQYVLPFRPPFGYYSNIFHIRSLIRKIKPDLLHVHYATGNGTLGRLCDFHPCILSVWGSDVLIAPCESQFMRRIVVKNLMHYDYVCSTSNVLTQAVRNLCPGLSYLRQIPIGVDTKRFSPDSVQKKDDWITIGTVKTLHPVYGIDILLNAFAIAKNILLSSAPEIGKKMRLRIAGDGHQRGELMKLSEKLRIAGNVEFLGYVPNDNVPDVLKKMDIFVALSRSESFGVAIVEASSCGLPVVVSRVGGLPEVVHDGFTGLIVEKENPSAAAAAIVRLAQNAALRKQLGDNGRRYVQENYEWERCLNLMYGVYEKLVVNKERKEGVL